ncbi:ankyrin repeat domain-containing protein 34B [Anoplopoma fimbria]|uniref:ankyrin repeat domain-containing protein 34B n=1 Tax=Anoplopoma fimbria TaxID=229290 RepID=UPI0023EDD399|nr:ankyrin repeat domain-containing protein 34B [Anoplopoma fimbria]
MADPLSDCSPLISAAASCKLRLVRLLVEGGAQVNGCNPRGETPLLAACKTLRGEPAGPATVKLLTYLLQNKADPNAQDRAGRTALMYACMERAGAQVASTLLAAGADPSMEDYSGASALVYAINAQHQSTLKVLVDACRARGRDIIIIATEMGVNGGPVTRHYLNVPPCPDTSPVSCMSPSDIVLRTGSPNSPEGENIFNFRGTSQSGSSSSSSSSSRHPSCELSPLSHCSTPPLRQRMLSEPWLAIHNLEHPPFPHGGSSSASPPALSRSITLPPPGSDSGVQLQKQEHGVSASPAQLPSTLLFIQSIRETGDIPSAVARLLCDLPGCRSCLLLQREGQEVNASPLGAA